MPPPYPTFTCIKCGLTFPHYVDASRPDLPARALTPRTIPQAYRVSVRAAHTPDEEWCPSCYTIASHQSREDAIHGQFHRPPQYAIHSSQWAMFGYGPDGPIPPAPPPPPPTRPGRPTRPTPPVRDREPETPMPPVPLDRKTTRTRQVDHLRRLVREFDYALDTLVEDEVDLSVVESALTAVLTS